MNNIASAFKPRNIKAFSKKIAERIAEKKRNFSNTTTKRGGGHGRGYEEPPTEDDIKYGVKPPNNIPRDVIISKFLGAQVVFWVWYNMRENGMVALGLAPPHYEHAFNDDISDDDEEFWEKNFVKETEQEIERMVQVYKNRDAKPVPIFEVTVEKWKDKISELTGK